MVNDFKDGVLCGLGVALNFVHPLRGGSAEGVLCTTLHSNDSRIFSNRAKSEDTR